jgi:hypothetical protein
MGFSILRTQLLLRIFRSKLSEDLAFLLAITLAAGFYSYEKSLPYQISGYISWALTIAAVIAWVWISFTSGFMKRGFFLAVSLTYWIVPQFIITGYATYAEGNYNAFFHISARVSELLTRAPLGSITKALETGGFVTSMSLLILCELMFFIGTVYRGMCKNFGWYCDFRQQYEV